MAGEAAWIASAQGFVLEPGLIAWFEERCDRLVAEALEYHEDLEPLRPAERKGRKKRRPGHNLALRFRDFKTETLRFLHDAGAPFTNNQAERNLRMMKLRMKILGVFRSERRAKDFATLHSVLSTAQEQGLNRIEMLIPGADRAARRPALLAGPAPAPSDRPQRRDQASARLTDSAFRPGTSPSISGQLPALYLKEKVLRNTQIAKISRAKTM